MISLVFPVYNPGPAIERTVAAARRLLRRRAGFGEVLFVLDGCTDGTDDYLANLLHANPDRRIRILGYSPNRGKGHAVCKGLLAARGRYRLFTDVDLAYPLADIIRVAEALRSGSDVAIASREHPASRVVVPAGLLGYAYRRRLQSHIYGLVARRLLGFAYKDTQAGLKGMTAEVVQTIIPNLSCDGFGFDCELLAACKRHQITVTEVPVRVSYTDAASTTGLASTYRMIRELWRIRRAWVRRAAAPVAEVMGPIVVPVPQLVEPTRTTAYVNTR